MEETTVAGSSTTTRTARYGFDPSERKRSRPGAPMYDPTQAARGSGGPSPQSNWDRIFRNTMSNQFGASGVNPLYQARSDVPAAVGGDPVGAAGVAGPSGASTEDPDAALMETFAPGVTGAPAAAQPPTLQSMASGTPKHADIWSRSVPPTTRRDTSMPAPLWTPRGPDAKFTVPSALTGPNGNPVSDRQNLNQGLALAAPGGAQGGWQGTPKPQQWQTPGRSGAMDVLAKYKTPGSSASLYAAPAKGNPFGWYSAFDA